MKISQTKFYAGSRDKLCRLGLAQPFIELQQMIFDTKIQLLRKRQAASTDQISELGERLTPGSWRRNDSSRNSWIGQFRYNEEFLARLGVEIQVSSRSDLLIRDIVHLRNSLQEGIIDIGVIVVPTDEMQIFLPDRTPSYRDAIRYIEKEFKEATTFPIIIIGIEHDGLSDKALPKKKTNIGEGVKSVQGTRRTR